MRVEKVNASTEALAEPTSGIWAEVAGETLALKPTPVEYQVTKYIRNAWKNRKYGVVESATVKAVTNGDVVAVRVEWPDFQHPDAEFPDACGLAFALSDSAPLDTFGSKEEPLGFWFWRSDSPDRADDAIARSMRDISSKKESLLRATARFIEEGEDHEASGRGRWVVVFQYPLTSNGDGVRLAPGHSSRFVLLVWEGANEERAGLAAMTPEWQHLDVEA